MEATEKQCTTCGNVKPLEAYSYRKERGTYHAQCKACRAAAIDRLRYGAAADTYREKERQRSQQRQPYLAEWQRNNRPTLTARARTKRQQAQTEEAPSCLVYFPTCRRTGQVFTARSSTAKYSAEGRRLLAQDKAAARKPATPCVCTACGQQFTPAYGNKRRALCSAACARSLKKQTKTPRRRARLHGAAFQQVHPHLIFTRDNWTCQLCGIPTPEQLRGTTEANAPELDHIVPISKGGPHSIENLQCACRACNRAKSNSLPTI